MGWASGSELMQALIVAVHAEVGDKVTRRRLYERFIPAFEDADCDTLDECTGIDTMFDIALVNARDAGKDDADDNDA